MHRDTQIGLAMSIVLIGFAAALCFPRDPPGAGASAFALPDSRELDASIEQLPVRAYTPSVGEASSRRETPPVAPAVASESEPTATVSAIADPVAAAEGAHPDAVDASVVQFDPSNPFLEDAPAASPAGQEHVHVVQSGDTLSGIAQKYLGSVARYPEIFNANRDLLDSPDDLKLGMELRIPTATR